MFGFNTDLTEEDVKYYKGKLETWDKFNTHINEMSEDGLKKAFIVELQTTKRLTMLKRIKGRINKVVNRRENSEIEKAVL